MSLSQFGFLIILLLFSHANSQCTSNPITETMYVDYQDYCKLVFDPCLNNTLARCSKLNCPIQSDQCITVMEMTTAQNCRRFCCRSSQDSINQDNPLSVKFCVSSSSYSSSYVNEQPNTFIGGYILIGVITTTFVAIFVGFCLCRKYRSTQNDLTNPNYNSDEPNAVIPGTCVDLNAYDINAEGPYFVNSNDSCAICLDKDVNLRTHCNHFYHGNCLIAWLKKKVNNPCPLCMGTNYNPVKVYCKQCHSGDKLVNIHAETNLETIKQYDTHKCQNCHRIGNSSFTLSDEGSKYKNLDEIKEDKEIQMKKDQQISEQQNSKHMKTQSHRSHRRQRKVQSSRNVKIEGKKQTLFSPRDEIDASAKKLKPDHNQTSVLP